MNDLTTCPVCFHEYKETGEYVPRMLPCTHTLCERCTLLLLGARYKLKCPECRRKHKAGYGVWTFQQNQYILSYVHQRSEGQDKSCGPDEEEGPELCEKHGNEATLFCTRDTCEAALCHLCMLEEHRDHADDLISMSEQKDRRKELQREKYETFDEELDTVVSHLRDRKMKIVKACRDLLAADREMDEKKEELLQAVADAFDKRRDDATKAMNNTMDLFREELQDIDKELENLESCRDTVQNQSSLKGIQAGMELVDTVKKRVFSRGEDIPFKNNAAGLLNLDVDVVCRVLELGEPPVITGWLKWNLKSVQTITVCGAGDDDCCTTRMFGMLV